MIYDAYGRPYQTPASIATRKLLSLATNDLQMSSFRPSILEEISRINELRKSCGVDPSGGKRITFRRYK